MDFFYSLLLPLKEKVSEGRDLVVSITVSLVLRTLPGIRWALGECVNDRGNE